MKDYWSILSIAVGCIIALVLITTCVQDYRSATLRMVEVRIIDKRYSPGHYEQSCSIKYIESGDIKVPITTCENNWIPPSWTVRYEDTGIRYTVTVSSGIFETLAVGQTKWLRFYEGGGYYHARYSEEFLLDKPTPENAAK